MSKCPDSNCPMHKMKLMHELEASRHSGVSAEKFLQSSFNLSDAEVQELKGTIESVSAHTSDEYSAICEDLERAADAHPCDVNVLFSRMANMILRFHRDDSNRTRGIKMLPERCRLSDAILVAEVDGGGDELPYTRYNGGFDNILFALKVKKMGSCLGKRRRDDDDDTPGEDDRPIKKNECIDPSSTCGESNASSLSSELSYRYVEPESDNIHIPSPPIDCILRTDGRGAKLVTSNEELELANYIRYLMDDCPGRLFVLGAILTHTKMRLTYYSRSVYVISDEFDIVRDPIALSLLMLLMLSRPLPDLGINLDFGHRDPFNTKVERNLKLISINGGDNFELTPNTQIKLSGKPLNLRRGQLLGRATSVYGVERPENCNIDLVAKFSWQPKSRRREDVTIQIARSVDPVHSPEIYGSGIAPGSSLPRRLIRECLIHPALPPEERELRVILLRKYLKVGALEDDQYLDVARQFVTYIHRLYSGAGLLHRDISIPNMAYFMKEEEVIGVLIDFDLAIYPAEAMNMITLGSTTTPISTEMIDPDANVIINDDNFHGNTGPNSQLFEERVGTGPFMAIETLDVLSPAYKHHLSHDLESIFYASVLFGNYCRCCYSPKPRRTYGSKIPDSDPKRTEIMDCWTIKSWPFVLVAKKEFLRDPETLLRFITHPPLRRVCRKLATLFRERREAVGLNARNLRLLSGEAAVLSGLGTVPARVGPIFPRYSQVWLVSSACGNCQKDCCRAQ